MLLSKIEYSNQNSCTMKSELNIAIEITKDLLPHLFLLIKLPEEECADLRLQECALLNLLAEFLKIQELLRVPQLETARRAFILWASLQSTETIVPEDIARAIKELSSGGHLPLFIREQNAGLLVSVPTLGTLDPLLDNRAIDSQTQRGTQTAPEETWNGFFDEPPTAVISTFPTSLPTPDVMSSVAAPSFVYPTTSVRVDFNSLLQSKFLAEFICLLDSTKQIVSEVL